jgi:Fungal Zn(2)-Cys(6) binuclear cluster domain.
MPGDLNSPKASTSPVNPPRRQNTSCDPCRRSKRRCVVQSDPDGILDAICANCRRLKRQCTFEFAIAQSNPFSRKRQRRDCGEPGTSTTQNESNDFDTTTEEVAGSPSNRFDATSIADQDVLAAWLNLDYDEITADSVNLFSTNLEPSNSFTTFRSEDISPEESERDSQLTVITPQLTRLRGGQNPESTSHQPTVGLSFDSPIYLLNSGIDAKIFGDRLARIYEAIATASASRFLEYDCNLYATKSRYRLGDSDSGSSNGSAPTSSTMHPINILPRVAFPVSSQAMPYEISLLGSVRFLVSFGRPIWQSTELGCAEEIR